MSFETSLGIRSYLKKGRGQVKALAVKSGNVSSIPGPYQVEREKWPAQQEGDCKRRSFWGAAMRVCLLVTSEATPMKSHQHDCVDMS